MLYILTILKNRMHPDMMFDKWLKTAYKLGDRLILLDNNSDDGTLEFLESFPDLEKKMIIHSGENRDFTKYEPQIRESLWKLLREIATEDDWILNLDADEFPEEKFVQQREKLLSFLERNQYEGAQFKLCDMWDLDSYRIDGRWSPFFLRLYKFKNKPFGINGHGLHLSNIPLYTHEIKKEKIYTCELRIKHYSIHTEEFRKEKHGYYTNNSSTELDLEHAQSIFSKRQEYKRFDEKRSYPEVLIASPIRNRDWVLPTFLQALENLNYPTNKLWFHFTLNNSEDKSKEILKEWREKTRFEKKRITIEELNFFYSGSGKERDWSSQVLANMEYMRNTHLDKLKHLKTCTYLFSIDSDVLVHPEVLNITLLQDKKIISPVFWAKWDSKEGESLPQVWLSGQYETSIPFMNMLRTKKSCFLVGGLGACTLIHREVPQRRVNYTSIYNLPSHMSGEDRNFCIRAVCAGYNLWATTHTPIRHVDRQELLQKELDQIQELGWWGEEHLLFPNRSSL